MNKYNLLILITILIGLLAFSACVPDESVADTPGETSTTTDDSMEREATETPEPTETVIAHTETPEIDPSPTADTAMMNSAEIEALIEEKVNGKHDLERIFNTARTREEWSEILDRMVGYGAQINEEEKERIINFLLERQSGISATPDNSTCDDDDLYDDNPCDDDSYDDSYDDDSYDDDSYDDDSDDDDSDDDDSYDESESEDD